MRFRGLLGALLVATSVASQEITADDYPSEDELTEALDSGELSAADYDLIQELLQLGYEVTDGAAPDTLAAADPAAGHDDDTASVATHTLVRHQYSLKSTADRSSRYRTRIGFGRGAWQGEIQMHREFSGAERFRSRWLEYHDADGVVERLIVGNFAAQFGHGTVIGYPSKRLRFVDRLRGESLVCPDYGGYNGMLLAWRRGEMRGGVLLSSNRDSLYSITVGGVELETNIKHLTAGLILAQTRVAERAAGRAVLYHRIGATLESAGRTGWMGAEVSMDPRRSTGGAVAVEGRLQAHGNRLSTAIWRYGDGFIDLTAGSRAVGLSQRDSLPEVHFGYSSRRAGQSGGLVQVVTALSSRWSSDINGSVGGRSRDDYEGNVRVGIERLIRRQTTVRLDHQMRYRSSDDAVASIRRFSRLELTQRFGRWWWRTYLGYRTMTGEPDAAAVFVRGGVLLQRDRMVEGWLHLSRIELPGMRLVRYYAYLLLNQTLFEHWVGSIKLIHSYNRHGRAPHATQIQFEMEMRL